MRCRTSGSSANRTISWISFLPPSSAGCDLPAMISWTGRSGCEQQLLEPVGVAQHQREPLVRRHAAREADRQHVGVEGGVDPAELGLGDAAVVRWTSRSRRRASIDQALAQLALDRPDVGAGDARRRRGRTPRRRRRRGRRRARSASSMTSRATHVGACTPLVIEPIGTSASSKAGHRPLNISRLTWPCSSETPLARWARRKPITAMLKTAASPPS